MRRLREVVWVEPVEYPTKCRDSAPQDRAGDLMAAFADTSIGAVLAPIGERTRSPCCHTSSLA